ncbi:hypothetical protein PAHAL_2G443900 [Panicum hallii]|uniref:Uncharacterized protein n=1 Tax=Panicum hallii TaxID=206008 RepID=A0A2S3H3T1_9POAL|nr:hypothetical protein PAHAL_2G443900 [Panicum hallii]
MPWDAVPVASFGRCGDGNQAASTSPAYDARPRAATQEKNTLAKSIRRKIHWPRYVRSL